MANYLSKSAVESLAHEKDMRVGREFMTGLNTVVETFVSEAVMRAKANKRKTIRLIDLSLILNPARAVNEPKEDKYEKGHTRPVREKPEGGNVIGRREPRGSYRIRKVSG